MELPKDKFILACLILTLLFKLYDIKVIYKYLYQSTDDKSDNITSIKINYLSRASIILPILLFILAPIILVIYKQYNYILPVLIVDILMYYVYGQYLMFAIVLAWKSTVTTTYKDIEMYK